MKIIKHRHHIVPRHAGGTDEPSNFIELTIEEHAEAHRQLFLKYGRWQDRIAWKALDGMIPHKEVIHQIHKEVGKKLVAYMEKHNPNKGRRHSAKSIEQMSRIKKGKVAHNKGKPMTEAQKEKLRNKIVTDEARANMRKPKRDTSKMGRYERTPEIREKIRQQRLKASES